MAVTTLRLNHLTGLDGVPRDVLIALLDRAAELREVARGQAPRLDTLREQTVANIFLENSTRTRTSFTLAARRLGADVVDILAGESSASKGETLLDTCLNLQAMGVQAFVIRTGAAGAPHQVARRLDRPVINAGDGRHEHPTQGLLDLMTLRSRLGELDGRTIAIVGDIINSRVARSALFGLTTLGAHVMLVGPPGLAPASLEAFPVQGGSLRVEREFDSAIAAADGVMMLRVQFERAAGEAIASVDEYRRRYALTRQRVTAMQDHAVILHPGPVNRGLEIDGDVADDPERSLILQQVANGVAVRMAVLSSLLGA